MIDEELLGTIQVLFRAPDVMALWGIPYPMRPGQAPLDLYRANRLSGWIWLGCPGWFGSMRAAEVRCVQGYLRRHAADIPQGPCEWSYVSDFTTVEQPSR